MPRKHPDRRGTRRQTISTKLATPPPAPTHPKLECGCWDDGGWLCRDHWARLSPPEQAARRAAWAGTT